LLATTSYYLQGFDYVRYCNWASYKKITWGEWIRSTYGNPGVIETPKVLKIDLTKSLPKTGYN
jgi:hypothetical protein